MQGLVAPAQALVIAKAPAVELGRALIDLRGRVNGQWRSALRLIWPCVKNPYARAQEAMDAARAEAKAGLAPAADAAQSEGDPSLGDTGIRMTALSAEEARRYELVRPLLAMRGGDRKRAIERLASEQGIGVTTIYRWLERAEEQGATGLKRRKRADAGKSSVPEAARQMFLARRLGRNTRHEKLALAVRIVREHFPDVSAAALRHMDRTIPAAARMGREEFNKAFMPTGEWVAPYPNHTWSFDYTIADLVVWDGDPRVKPYRPWVTAIIDEASGSPMAILYSRDHPDRFALRSVLLMAILPKRHKSWPQHGLPERLHGDNGKIQRSQWLEDVCRQISIALPVDLERRFSNAYESWQNGHIEEFWKDLHAMYEARFAEVGAYCGRSPEERKKFDGFIGDSQRPADWRRLPTVAQINAAAQDWIAGEYLLREHSRLKMSRNDAWQLAAEGHVNLADEAWLRQILMFKERRQVRRARIALNGFSYWSERLIGHEGREVPVWWDAAHLETILVLDQDGREICWAEAERPQELGDQQSLAEYRRKRAAALGRRRELAAAASEVGDLLPAPAARDIAAQLQEAADRADAVLMPMATRLAPKPIEQPAADAGLEYLAQRAGELTADDVRGGDDMQPTLPLEVLAGQQSSTGFDSEPQVGLTFHGIDFGAGSSRHNPDTPQNLPPDEAGPELDPTPQTPGDTEDSMGEGLTACDPEAARLAERRLSSGCAPSQPGINEDVRAGAVGEQDQPRLPQSFERWFRDRYGPYGDAPKQPACMRDAARRQLAANYASTKDSADGSRDQ